MGYASLRECVADLERTGNSCASTTRSIPISKRPRSSAASTRPSGPALLFTRVKGCRFPMVSNLFGTLERTRFLFRDTLAGRPASGRAEGRSGELLASIPGATAMCRARCGICGPSGCASGPVLRARDDDRRLPQLVCWPRDGGPFITLPQVYTEDADRPGWRHSNLGMYRVQLSGNEYRAGSRGRPALPDPSRHRRPSCGGAAPRRAVPRQHLRRRAAGHDAGRRDAAARRIAGAGVRRRAGRPARAADRRSRTRCRSPPTPTSASPAPSIPSCNCPKGRSAITSATTAWRIRFRC